MLVDFKNAGVEHPDGETLIACVQQTGGLGLSLGVGFELLTWSPITQRCELWIIWRQVVRSSCSAGTARLISLVPCIRMNIIGTPYCRYEG